MPRRLRRRLRAGIAGFTTAALLSVVLVSSGGHASSASSASSPRAARRQASGPTAPRSVTATPGDAFATVRWITPASSNGSTITGYVITPYIGYSAQRSVTVGRVNEATITGLQNARAYTFQVAAKNAQGTGPPRSSAGIVVGSPVAPTSVKASRGVRSSTVRWNAPTSENGSPITGYVVVPFLAGAALKARTYSGTELQAVVTGLAVGRTYRFRVGARNDRGLGPRSVSSNVTNPTGPLGPESPPPAGGYFPTLAPGAALPTEASCDGAVHFSAWEPRPENKAANHRVPARPPKVRKHPDFNPTWQTKFRRRITGNFTGTTDEIIQWAACKWGLSDEMLRAEAVIESQWVMGREGDYEARSSGRCTYDDQRDPCPTSFGILQIKWFYNPDSNPRNNSYPMSKNMTAFSVDYTAAKLRGCYEGWEYFGSKSRGDLWGCMGAWFSGGWHDSAADGYIQRVKSAYNSKPWRHW